MNKVKGIYTFYPIKDEDLQLRDYEVGLLMMSILNWKSNYGTAHLITNDKGKKYFVDLGIDNLWDKIKLVELESGDICTDIFPDVYRIKALEKEKTPFCLMEYDTIIKRGIDKSKFEGDVFLPYIETSGKEKYAITNFMYFNNQGLLKNYIKECLKYMQDNSNIIPTSPLIAVSNPIPPPLCVDTTDKEKFFLNLGLNNLLLNLVDKKNIKVNYLITKELNDDTRTEFPFTELSKVENITLFMLSRLNRETIRNMSKIYDSREKKWVDSYHMKRQYYIDKVRETLLITQGNEWSLLFEEVIKDSPLVDITAFHKGVQFYWTRRLSHKIIDF